MRLQMHLNRNIGRTYKVAIGVLVRLVAPSIQKDCCTLLFSTGNEIVDPLLALRTDNRAQVSALFKSPVHIQLLGSLHNFWQPFFCLTDHGSCAQRHATLTSSSK